MTFLVLSLLKCHIQ
nr:unnamed protein product [Callosobruchus analis]